MIVVTGAAGFIGSNIVRGLNRSGHDRIVVVDELSNGDKCRNLSGCQFSDYIDKDDLLDEFGKLGKITAVFHQGACSDTTETDGKYMMETNYTYSKNLLRSCLSQKVPFVYASSAAVYGLGDKPFSESPEQEEPLNVYGFSKLVFDQHVRTILPTAESQILGLRYFNVYGPGEEHKGHMASVILKMWAQHRNKEDITLFEGSDNFLRDFVYVEDAVRVNLHFLETGRSGIVNCGTGTTRSFLELGNITSTQLPGSKIKFVPMPAKLREKYQTFTCADGSALRQLGYTDEFESLENGIAKYVEALNIQANRSSSVRR